ncbi:MAG: enoyl-CoA hydratase/isomerase family protein [Bdellovibrionales bacterium]|nr:enoyl-CoA hydratase/isomerase family protein [Bdellovibrionales bacterium]
MKEFILFTEHKKSDQTILLEVKLNNPKKLNALNYEMIESLNREFSKWIHREDLSAVFIHCVEGRAFCAGGDIVGLYHLIQENKKHEEKLLSVVKDFFHKEYTTNYLLRQFNKPIVLWGDGIVMGGGMGLFMSASHPVATENSLFAMPEVSIGFFPDVGASYFLTRLRKDLGKYLALTACLWNAKTNQFLGLNKWFFEHKDKQKIFDFLKQKSFKDKKDFDVQLQSIYKTPDFLSQQSCWIQEFEKEIVKYLEFEDLKTFYDHFSQSDFSDKQWNKNLQNFLKASPTSLALVFEQFKRAKKQEDLKALFEMETIIAFRTCLKHDFSEGIRALLVDKTKKPYWNPSHVHQIEFDQINEYFIPQADWDYKI